MATITEAFASVFRDYVTAGVPASGENDPVKSEIRALGPIIESAISSAAFGALVDVVYEDRASLDADLAHAAETVALVYGDSDDANNDLYVKVGASGAGSWTNTGALRSAFTSAAAEGVAAAEAARDEAQGFADDMAEAVSAISGGSAVYSGAGPIFPIMTDEQGEVLLGFDSGSGEIVGRGILPFDEMTAAVPARFVGERGMVPVLVDAAGHVLIGFDLDRSRGFMHGVSDSPVPTPTALAAEPPVLKTLQHFLAYGQSLSVGANSGALVSTSQPFSNVTFIGGPRAWSGSAAAFGTFKPLVEDSTNPAPDGNTGRGETPCSGAANYASVIAAREFGIDPADHVILASTAGRGGWRIDQLDKGNEWYADNFLRHVQEAVALEPDYACHAVDWIQGENDGLRETSRGDYSAALNALIADANADIRAIATEQESPVYFGISVTAGYSAAWGQVQLAQRDVARSNPLAFITCPLYQFMNQQNTDGLHLTSATMVWRSAYFGRAMARLMHGGVLPRWLDAVSATLTGKTVRVRLDVPVRPLQFDVLTIGETENYGFCVEDSTGTVAVGSVYIEGDDVVIELVDAPTGTVEVRYALDYLGTNAVITGGATGNLCDSAPETVTVGGVVRPLKNFLVPFALTAIDLGS